MASVNTDEINPFITIGTKIDGKLSVKPRAFIELLILDVIN